MRITKRAGKTFLKMSSAEWLKEGSRMGWVKPTGKQIYASILSSMTLKEKRYSSLLKLMQESPTEVEPILITVSDIVSHITISGYGNDFQLVPVGESSAVVLSEQDSVEIMAESLLSLMKRMPSNPELFPVVASIQADRNFSIYISYRKEYGEKAYLVPHMNGTAMNGIVAEFTGTVLNQSGTARNGGPVGIGKGCAEVPHARPDKQQKQLDNLSRLHRNVRNEEDVEEVSNTAGYLAANSVLKFYPQRFDSNSATHHDYRYWIVELSFLPGTGLDVGSKMRAVTWFSNISNKSLDEDSQNPNRILAKRSEIGSLCMSLGIYDIFIAMGTKCEHYYDVQMRKPVQERDNPEKILTVSLSDYSDKIRESICQKEELNKMMIEQYGVSRQESEQFLVEAFNQGLAGNLLSASSQQGV